MQSSEMSQWILCLVATLGALGAGCAPTQFREAIPYTTARHHATDAKLQRVKHYPCLRADADLIEELDFALAERQDLGIAQERALAFLDASHRAALASTRNELDRMSDAGWNEIHHRYDQGRAAAAAEARSDVWRRFVADTDTQHQDLRSRVEQARSVHDVHAVLKPIRAGVEPSIKTAGRFGRAAPWFLFSVPSLLTVKTIHDHEYRGPQDAAFNSAVRYVPGGTRPESDSAPEGQDENWALLEQYAPVVVQEQPAADAPYDARVDQIGRVQAADEIHVETDPSQPSVYGYSRRIRIDGHEHLQLIYTQWYPEHPKLKKGDPEQGHLEGTTLRITLDQQRRPALFETVYNCGCYHRLYPSQELEAASRQQFGEPEKGKQFAIERNVPGKIDMIVPKAVDAVETARPVVRARAGWHGIVDVAMTEAGHQSEVVEMRKYVLRPYAELERLELGNGRYTSMFQDNGLVKGAQRLEGVFFTPIGILSAGQPRQRGTQLIHWDHYDFDDPQLFTRTLRLPGDF